MGKNTDKLGVMEKDNKSVFEVNQSLYIFVIGFRKLLQIMRKRIYCLFIALFIVSPCLVIAQSSDDELMAVQDTVERRKGFLGRILNYFDETNKEKPYKKFDVSVIGGPFYTTDAKFGIGVVSAGLYRMKGCTMDMQPSNVTLFANISTVGFYMLGLKGNNLFPEDNYRLNYTAFFYSFPSYYWGIGYLNGDNDENKSKIDRFQSKVKVEFLVKLCENLYVGPSVMWDYAKAGDVTSQALPLFDGMALTQRNYGIGASVQYDTRDVINNASRGVHLYLAQEVRPNWLGNDYAFSTTSFIARMYKSVWNGGVIASELQGTFNFGNPSWAMMAELGGSNTMRGYYEGRYRDKHSIMAQIELRQKVWRRNGVVLWAGAGNVFHDKDTFRKVLPNYGIGYRWEFKKRVNVRLDMGFGKSGQSGFIFNINEAF